MLTLAIGDSDGIRREADRCRGISARLRDLSWLAEAIRAVVVRDVEDALRAGVDRDGDPVEPIRPATVERRERAGRGTGPPRVADDASRFLAGLRSEVVALDAGGKLVRVFWEGVPFLRFHVEGTARMVARDPVGITPAGRAAVDAAVERAFRDLFEATD